MNTMQLQTVRRPWGWYQVIYHSHDYWTKIISLNPCESLSLQVHENRSEYWTPLDSGLRGTIGGVTLDLEVGKRYDVMSYIAHRISNVSEYPATLIEIATGSPEEDDIIRLEDKYGRVE